MAWSEGEHGSKEERGGGCYGYFSAQPWWACQMLTGREALRESAQPPETWRFTPLTYLAWIGLLPHCSRSNTALSLICEIDDGHVVADQGDDNVDDDWNHDYSDGEDRHGDKGSHAKVFTCRIFATHEKLKSVLSDCSRPLHQHCSFCHLKLLSFPTAKTKKHSFVPSAISP